jgi:hypothetical protein
MVTIVKYKFTNTYGKQCELYFFQVNYNCGV